MTFTFKPRPGGCIRAELGESGGEPHLWLHLMSKQAKSAAVFIPLDRVEEVIAGVRGAARQSGGIPTAAVLAPAERQFLTFALDLAANEMANRGDEFDDEDDAALARLRQLATEGAGA